ncbi:hypothetical protein E3O68_07135 [Cryobacterium sp. TMB3-1-2]|uniref:hypothetical protein n=1 Tax=Cryobacterium sp. TMB3-10 TaxID=1259209 RepID=UPI00106AED79|nr:hypothetical protein [Cryobacterium sp. TMB3-10]TFC55227.1 hypothetical protein E3O68_07135 [Cryobacterium sp. TMB3-1-2]
MAATLISGLSGFVVMLLAVRALGSSGYAVFGVFWSSLFLIVGILFGIQQETTRATAVETELRAVAESGKTAPPVRRRPRRSLWVFAALVAAGVVAVVLVSGIWWAPATLGAEHAGLVLQVAIGAGANVFVATLSGVFAGAHRWRHLAAVIGLDGIFRFAAVVGAVLVGGDLQELAWAVILPFPLSLAVVVLASPRTTMSISWTSLGFGRLLVNSGHTVIAATAMALIVNGFPMVLAFFGHPEQQDELGSLILAITFTRAPVLVPLFALQSYLITRFTTSPLSPWRLIGQTFAVIGIAMATLGGATALWGRVAFDWISRGDFLLSSAALVPLVVSSGVIGALCVTGAALVARGQHREYAAGWIVAAVVSIVVLFIPLSLETRAALALSTGPLVGLTVQCGFLRRRLRTEGKLADRPGTDSQSGR